MHLRCPELEPFYYRVFLFPSMSDKVAVIGAFDTAVLL